MKKTDRKSGKGRTVLITGASSGIGREFARYYASQGYRLILVARRRQRLEELAAQLKVPARILIRDLSRETECRQLLDELRDENIDIFINNAGFGTCGKFTQTDLDKEIRMIHVNDIAVHILMKGILQRMMLVNSGVILNVASSAGLLPGGPYMAGYYASKAYVVSLTRAVERELQEAHSRVRVCALCPGPVNTEFNQNADVVFALRGITAEYCVKEAIRGIHRHQTIIVPGFWMGLAMGLQHAVPPAIVTAICARQQRRKL